MNGENNFLPQLIDISDRCSYRVRRKSNPQSFLQSPVYRFSDSGRLLYFSRIISFFVHRFFDVPESIFAKLCRTMRYVPKLTMSYGVFNCSYVPPKNLRCKNNFCKFADPESALWALQFRNWREIEKSKTAGSICGLATTSIHTKHGGGPTSHGWDRLSPWGMEWGR